MNSFQACGVKKFRRSLTPLNPVKKKERCVMWNMTRRRTVGG